MFIKSTLYVGVFLGASALFGCAGTTSHVAQPNTSESWAAHEPEPFATPIPIVQEGQTPALGATTDTPPEAIAPTYARTTFMRMPVANRLRSSSDGEFVRRRVKGGLLLGFSTPLLVSGGAVIHLATDHGSTKEIPFLLGCSIIAGGLGMAVPGIYMLVTDPPPYQFNARIQPTLRVGPTGVQFSTSF
jgi:hypothetical protein